MTPYEPRHEKTCLGTDHLIFWGGGGHGWVFSSRFSFDRKTDFFFSQSESQNIFFQDKAKTKYFFSKQHICSKCILLDLYVRVFLEPNIHGYIVYMFVYTCILDIWVRVYMSRDMTKPATWQNQQNGCAPSEDSDQPGHPPSLIMGIRPVWSESSLSAWRSIGSLATHWAHSEDSDQTGLIWVFAGPTLILLVLSCRGSYVHIKTFLISAI